MIHLHYLPLPNLVSRSAGTSFTFAGVILLGFYSAASAQESLPPPDQRLVNVAAEMEAARAVAAEPLPPAAEPESVASESATAPAGPEISINGRAVAETPRRFQYHLSLVVRGVYDDNINISSSGRVSDYYFAIEPSISLGFGNPEEESKNFLSFIYRPSIFLFVDNSQNDAVQHLIRLQAGRQFGRLALSLSQDVQILDGVDLNTISDPTGHSANIDLGRRARHNIFTTGVGDTYELTGKLFLSNSFGLAIDDYPSEQGIGSKNFYGNLFINYNYSPKLVIGLGGTGGYNTVDNSGGVQASSPDQTYEQVNVRLSYNATAKVSLTGSVGVEFRQFENARGTYVSPVFDLTASYQPFDGTLITLSGSRRTQNSASLAGEDYASTSINFTVQQRFLQRFSLGLAVGYENLDYFSTTNNGNGNRNDNYYYIEPSVDLSITRFWTAGAYYLHREDSSSFDFFSFYDNQFGVRSALTF